MTSGVGKGNWRGLGSVVGQRLWSLNGQWICAAAQQRTGLQDFGQPQLEPALSMLINSLEAEAHLHPLGRLLMRVHLRDLLETRLRLVADWEDSQHPLDSVTMERPVFIVGMPRSGSTFLHELLAEDPANRAPRVWEVMFPIAKGSCQDSEQRRICKAERCLWWFRKLAPEADSVFPMRAWTPHECVAIHSYTFQSEEFVSTCRIPSYEKFLRASDRKGAYVWQKRFLQSLQRGRTPRRWILKSPDHAHSLEGLLAVFPDAAIIQTHRNPFQVLRSSVELTRVLQGLYAWPDNLEQLAAREVRVLAEGTERFIRFRDEHPELAERFIDVKYTDLISDPLLTVAEIYERLEMPLTAEARGRMQRLASQRSRYQGIQRGSFSKGLDRTVVDEARRFDLYCSRFGVTAQSAELSR